MLPREIGPLVAWAGNLGRPGDLQLQQETDEHGERRWSFYRQLDEDGWVEVWLRPWPRDRFDARPSIRVGAWPEKEPELDPLARAQAIIDAYDDTPG